MSLSSIPFESAPPQLKQDIQGFDNNIENELQKVSALKSILQELHENFNNNSQLMDNILKSATELSNVETKVRLITNEAQSAGELFHNLSQGQTKNTQQFFNDIALDCNKRIEKQTATLDELEKIVKVKPTDISFNQALYDVLNNQFESFLDVSLELSKFHDEFLRVRELVRDKNRNEIN